MQCDSAMRLTYTSVAAITVAVMFIIAVAAFLIYVPLSTVLAAALIALALMVMFALGIQAGGRRIRIRRERKLS